MNKDNEELIDLNLKVFKKELCDNKSKHEIKKCLKYHGKQDFIREFKGFNYLPILCKKQIYNKSCKKGNKCLLCHNYFEYLYHPENYKKYYCKNEYNCKLDLFCPYAHKVNELKNIPIHTLEFNRDFYINYFKTIICPFKFKEHNKKNCVYYHSFIDIRRNINVHDYNIKLCNLWNYKNIKFYNEGCKKGVECKFSHGFFENFYHPNNYKKKRCFKFENCNNQHCPFLHSD